jgi:outer membrane lipoprotein-sorting protein
MHRPFLPCLLLSLALLAGSFMPAPVSQTHAASVLPMHAAPGLPGPAAIDRISASMESRQVQQGRSVTLKGDIYYQRNGSMITHFTYPREYMVIANKLGETKIYDPIKNTVLQYQNFLFSTQSSQFYYFFTGKIADMGLTRIGYVQDKTYNEGSLLVTEWKLKTPDKRTSIQRIKIVYDGQRPVYMHYQEGSGKIFRKVFYYNYQALDAYYFPSTTTEIVYDKGDSVVSKTNYKDFKLNEQATGPYFNFTIPANAKIEQ